MGLMINYKGANRYGKIEKVVIDDNNRGKIYVGIYDSKEASADINNKLDVLIRSNTLELNNSIKSDAYNSVKAVMHSASDVFEEGQPCDICALEASACATCAHNSELDVSGTFETGLEGGV